MDHREASAFQNEALEIKHGKHNKSAREFYVKMVSSEI